MAAWNEHYVVICMARMVARTVVICTCSNHLTRQCTTWTRHTLWHSSLRVQIQVQSTLHSTAFPNSFRECISLYVPCALNSAKIVKSPAARSPFALIILIKRKVWLASLSQQHLSWQFNMKNPVLNSVIFY